MNFSYTKFFITYFSAYYPAKTEVSYLSSITSKIESVISLNNEMGKRTSLTELVEQFAGISDQLEAVTTKDITGVTVTEGSLGDSKKVADAVNRDRQELIASIQSEIDNLDVKESGTYTKLLNNIAKRHTLLIRNYRTKSTVESGCQSLSRNGMTHTQNSLRI